MHSSTAVTAVFKPGFVIIEPRTCLVLGSRLINLFAAVFSLRFTMEVYMSSMMSNGDEHMIGEASDFTGATSFSPPEKRGRRRARREPSSKYKGVTKVHERKWGAHTFSKPQRVWLGTVKSETEAAMAYNSATAKLPLSDHDRNFPWTRVNAEETKFQRQFSADTAMKMLKGNIYELKFKEYLKKQHEEMTGISFDANSSIKKTFPEGTVTK